VRRNRLQDLTNEKYEILMDFESMHSIQPMDF
jgi:hypothetical protein